MERKEILVVVLIGVLLITTALQTAQLMGLSKSSVVVSAKTGAAPSPTANSRAASAPAVPANLQNLPSMVGGC